MDATFKFKDKGPAITKALLHLCEIWLFENFISYCLFVGKIYTDRLFYWWNTDSWQIIPSEHNFDISFQCCLEKIGFKASSWHYGIFRTRSTPFKWIYNTAMYMEPFSIKNWVSVNTEHKTIIFVLCGDNISRWEKVELEKIKVLITSYQLVKL